MNIDQATRRDVRSLLNDYRYFVANSGAMLAGAINVVTTLTFPIPVDIVALSGFGTAIGAAGFPGTPAIGGLDSFRVEISRQTGDKLTTAEVPAWAVLGSGQFPAVLPKAFKVNGGEALDLIFDNTAAVTNTAYIVFWSIETRGR